MDRYKKETKANLCKEAERSDGVHEEAARNEGLPKAGRRHRRPRSERPRRTRRQNLRRVLLFLGVFALMSALWFWINYGSVPFEQILFHLRVPMTEGNMGPVFTYLLVVPVVSLLLTWLFLRLILADIPPKHRRRRRFVLGLRRHRTVISVAIVAIGLVTILQVIGIPSFVLAYINESNEMERYYVDPASVKLTFPEKKRNIIHLMLESMESTYSSREFDGAFNENYIPRLTELAMDPHYLHFSNTDKLGGSLEMPGLAWTTASLVGQTSGIPVKIPIDPSAYRPDQRFIPGALTIGEILRPQGYHLEAMMGSDSSFGGVKAYLEQHGDFRIDDYPAAIRDGLIPPDYHVFWGYEDKKLFKFAKDRLTALSQSDQPFYFHITTIDTHFPEGYVPPGAPQPYLSPYGNAIHCSDQEIYDFVRWFEKQPFYDNTTLVISGDHLSLAHTFFLGMPLGYQRTVYDLIVNPVKMPPEDRRHHRGFCVIDLFPTMLSTAGVKIEGDRLAYGTDLCAERKTLIEELGADGFRDMITPYSSFYSNRFLFTKR